MAQPPAGEQRGVLVTYAAYMMNVADGPALERGLDYRRNWPPAGITLIEVARADGFEVFTHPERIEVGTT